MGPVPRSPCSRRSACRATPGAEGPEVMRAAGAHTATTSAPPAWPPLGMPLIRISSNPDGGPARREVARGDLFGAAGGETNHDTVVADLAALHESQIVFGGVQPATDRLALLDVAQLNQRLTAGCQV